VVSEDAEREAAAAAAAAAGASSSSDPDSNSGSIDTAVFVEAVPAAAAAPVSPFAAAGVQQQGVTHAPSSGVFGSLLYNSGTAAADAAAAVPQTAADAAADATADTAGKPDQSATLPAAASKFRRPPKKASSFTHGSTDDDVKPSSATTSRRPRASFDIGAAAARTLGRMSLDFSGPHRRQQQQPQNLLHFSSAAEAARATGTSALGRISLPGRSRAVMEASSLYTHLILPEPTASVPGGRSGGSQRLLAVTADGALLPGGSVNAACGGMGRAQSDVLLFDEHEQPDVILEGSREGNAFDSSSSSWAWGGSGDNNIQTAGGQLSSSVGSFSLAGRDADATVLQLPAGTPDAAGNENNNNDSMFSNGGFGGDIVPIVQGQLQQLAAAVINKRVSIDLQGSSSSTSDRRRSFGSFTFSRQLSPAPTGAGFTADMTGWTVAESVLGCDTAAENGCTEMFNTQAAVIPTLPENIYEHTIAAVPNFGARAAPKASWMFFIVNFVLLSALFGASFVEVYVG
jgi:hypothetical protein